MFLRMLLRGKFLSTLRHLKNYVLLRAPRRPLVLHLGCGKRKIEGSVNIDCNWSKATDYVGDIANLPCPPESVERIETYHVIEHIPHPIVEPMLKKWHRILRPGGVLVIECPNLDAAMRDYLSGNRERLLNIFGRQRFPGDAHLYGYSPDSLSEMLRQVGFDEVVQAEPQDYHAAQEPCQRIECRKAA
jgi:predicted SAM-dependent methyltransferase